MRPGCPANSSGGVSAQGGGTQESQGRPEMGKQLRLKEATAPGISRAEWQEGDGWEMAQAPVGAGSLDSSPGHWSAGGSERAA